MDDIEEVEKMPRVVLMNAADDVEVRRSEVFCSKIIQQRSNHQVRYRAGEAFVKLVRYCYPDCAGPDDKGFWPRPFKSNIPCFNCHRRFDGPPVFMPITTIENKREEFGCFCSGPCMNTYLHANNDSNLPGRAADAFEYMQDVYGFRGDCIGLAPHFSQLQEYGGDLTNEQFDAIVNNPAVSTHIRMEPFRPTSVVIEWLESSAPQPPSSASGGGVNVPRAQQALVPSSSVLDEVMGTKAPDANHHHRWDVRGLKQPSQEDIEKRLATLPPQEERTGMYALYLSRKGGFDAVAEDESDAAPSVVDPAAKSANASARASNTSKKGSAGGGGAKKKPSAGGGTAAAPGAAKKRAATPQQPQPTAAPVSMADMLKPMKRPTGAPASKKKKVGQ